MNPDVSREIFTTPVSHVLPQSASLVPGCSPFSFFQGKLQFSDIPSVSLSQTITQSRNNPTSDYFPSLGYLILNYSMRKFPISSVVEGFSKLAVLQKHVWSFLKIQMCRCHPRDSDSSAFLYSYNQYNIRYLFGSSKS